MRILSRYFVVGFLTYYVAIIAVSLLIIAIIEMMVNFDHVIEYGEGLSGVATYFFLRLPSYYLPFLLPVGSYGAAFLCMGLPARSLEILAAKASGIAPGRLAAPVILTATALSLFALLLNETIVLDATRRFNLEEGGGELFQDHGAFWYHRGDMIFSVEAADRDTQTLQGITIYERHRDGRLLRSIEADSARIEDDRRWHLDRARFRTFSDDPEAAPQIEVRETAWLDLGNMDDLSLLGADARALSLPRLRDYIDALEDEGRDTTRFRALWHARLADPLSVVLFALLGVPLGMAVEHSRSLAVAALQGVALVGAYYGLQTTASVLGAGGIAAAAFAPWIVLAIFTAFGAWRMAASSGTTR